MLACLPPSFYARVRLYFLLLRSRPPFTGVLQGEFPKVLWRVLSECLLETPRKCPGQCSGECLGNWEQPGECSRECFSSIFPKEKQSWELSLRHCHFPVHFQEHSLGTFWKSPKAWKRLKGRNPEGKNFRKLLRRKQSSAKISKISRNTLKSSKSDIFYLLRNLLRYLLGTFSSSAKFPEVFTLCVFTLWLFSESAPKALAGALSQPLSQ